MQRLAKKTNLESDFIFEGAGFPISLPNDIRYRDST